MDEKNTPNKKTVIFILKLIKVYVLQTRKYFDPLLAGLCPRANIRSVAKPFYITLVKSGCMELSSSSQILLIIVWMGMVIGLCWTIGYLESNTIYHSIS